MAFLNAAPPTSDIDRPPATSDPIVITLILIAIGLWAAFTIWNGYTLFSPAFTPTDPHATYCDNLHSNNVFDLRRCQQYRSDKFLHPAETIPSFWAFVAALGFAAAMATRLSNLGLVRLTVGGTTLAMMIGRLIDTGFDFSLMNLFQVPSATQFFITPFSMILTGGTAIFGVATAVASAFGVMVGVPSLLFNQILQFESAVNIHRYETSGLSGYIVRLVYWLQRKPLPDQPPDESRGARLATLAEIASIHRPGAPESMGFGHIDGPLAIKTDKHVLIMASTRSGKGVTLIIPHLLRYRGSAFVLDPKGENAKATWRTRAALNNQVHVLDPFGISGRPRSRFNPLARFTPDNMEAESKALAAAIFVVGDRERDHWTASGQQLLAAIILYVYLAPDIPRENKDLPTVRRILLGGLDIALEAMSEMTEADGLLQALATSFLRTPEKEFGSIVSTAQRQTEILDNPAMIACLSASGPGPEVDFKAWHRGTMSVFLCLSAPKFPVFNRWLRLILTSALDEMTDTLQPPRLPVCFMLDELATLGHLPAVENAVGLAAGYGIQLVTVFQDVAQMKDLYKGRWASFIGNSGVRAIFNLDDYDSAEYWSKFIGGRITETHSRQEDMYGGSKGQGVGEAMRPLFPPDRLMMQFAAGKMLVLAQGQRPIVTDRIAYWDDTSLTGLWDDPRRPAPTTNNATRPPPPIPPTAAPPLAPRPQPPAPGGAMLRGADFIKSAGAPPPPRQPVAGAPAPVNQPPAPNATQKPVAQTPPPRPALKVDMDALTAALMQQAEPAAPPVTPPLGPQGYRMVVKPKKDGNGV